MGFLGGSDDTSIKKITWVLLLVLSFTNNVRVHALYQSVHLSLILLTNLQSGKGRDNYQR